MVSIRLKDVTLDFPIFASEHRSLKRRLINLLSGDIIASDSVGTRKVSVLKNISLTIKEGERIGVVGANGAGKSMFLRLLSGIYVPTHGEIEVIGSVSSMLNINLGIDGEISGLENLYLRSLLLGISKKEVSEALHKLADFTELGEFLHYPTKTYSTGMKMRVAFAVATQSSGDIVLLDEWLSVGDKDFKKKAETRLLDLIKNAKILVMASHSRSLIERLCTRVILINEGNIVMDADVKSVCDFYFGTPKR